MLPTLPIVFRRWIVKGGCDLFKYNRYLRERVLSGGLVVSSVTLLGFAVGYMERRSFLSALNIDADMIDVAPNTIFFYSFDVLIPLLVLFSIVLVFGSTLLNLGAIFWKVFKAGEWLPKETRKTFRYKSNRLLEWSRTKLQYEQDDSEGKANRILKSTGVYVLSSTVFVLLLFLASERGERKAAEWLEEIQSVGSSDNSSLIAKEMDGVEYKIAMCGQTRCAAISLEEKSIVYIDIRADRIIGASTHQFE